MRIATLQFCPTLGDPVSSIQKADKLLRKAETAGKLNDLDILVLPEQAFTGYNFPTEEAISPLLEPTSSGITTQWVQTTAKRLRCTVAAGYPEIASDGTAYNALVFAASSGKVIAHYRKSFLYYTDDIWASEGPGFYHGKLALGDSQKGGVVVKASAGICMDINPYKFEAPWSLYEFANHAREHQVQLVVVSMAWLTRMPREDLAGNASMPDLDTVTYWIERFRPLIEAQGPEEEVIVIFANRTGEEGAAALVGEVRYAGSSCVMGMKKGGMSSVRIFELLGRAEEGVLVVDTNGEARFGLKSRTSDGGSDEASETEGDADDLQDETFDVEGKQAYKADSNADDLNSRRVGL